MKRRIGRSIGRARLRVVGSNEAAFRATLGAMEAFVRVGVPLSALGVQVVPLSRDEVCTAIVVTGGSGVTWRINDYPLAPPAAERHKEWVAWVTELLVGSDIPKPVRDSAYKASILSSPRGTRALEETLLKSGLEVRTAGAKR